MAVTKKTPKATAAPKLTPDQRALRDLAKGIARQARKLADAAGALAEAPAAARPAERFHAACRAALPALKAWEQGHGGDPADGGEDGNEEAE